MAERGDVEELREVMTVLGEKGLSVLQGIVDLLPHLLREVYAVFYTEENATRIGKSIGAYYQALRGSGMPEAIVTQLTYRYAESASLGSLLTLIRSAIEGERRKGLPETETAGREIGMTVYRALPTGEGEG